MEETGSLVVFDPESRANEFTLSLTPAYVIATVSPSLRSSLEEAERKVESVHLLGAFIRKFLEWAERRIAGLTGPYPLGKVDVRLGVEGLEVCLGSSAVRFGPGHYDPAAAGVFIDQLARLRK